MQIPHCTPPLSMKASCSGWSRSPRARPSMVSTTAPSAWYATIHLLQEESFSYFLHETNRRNGLVRDKTRRGWPASIAAVGMALTAYPVGVERGFIERGEAVRRVLATLRFLWKCPQGKGTGASGYK